MPSPSLMRGWVRARFVSPGARNSGWHPNSVEKKSSIATTRSGGTPVLAATSAGFHTGIASNAFFIALPAAGFGRPTFSALVAPPIAADKLWFTDRMWVRVTRITSAGSKPNPFT